MARYKGTFSVAANYEPLVGGPFDARQLVETQADLISPDIWRQTNGDVWVYIGMLVVVAKDPDQNNNGLYILKSLDYTSLDNWEKQATQVDIAQLQSQIDNIEIGAGGVSIEVETETDLPRQGDVNATYYVKENLSIHRWNEETQSYDSYGGAVELDINIIHGGNANGTD